LTSHGSNCIYCVKVRFLFGLKTDFQGRKKEGGRERDATGKAEQVIG